MKEKLEQLHEILKQDFLQGFHQHRHNLLSGHYQTSDQKAVTPRNVDLYLYDLYKVPEADAAEGVNFTFGGLFALREVLQDLYKLFPELEGKLQVYSTVQPLPKGPDFEETPRKHKFQVDDELLFVEDEDEAHTVEDEDQYYDTPVTVVSQEVDPGPDGYKVRTNDGRIIFVWETELELKPTPTEVAQSI